jgi:hypothetical protein
LGGDQPDELESRRVAESEQHRGQLDLGKVGMDQDPGSGGHYSSTFLERLLGRDGFNHSMELERYVDRS